MEPTTKGKIVRQINIKLVRNIIVEWGNEKDEHRHPHFNWNTNLFLWTAGCNKAKFAALVYMQSPFTKHIHLTIYSICFPSPFIINKYAFPSFTFVSRSYCWRLRFFEIFQSKKKAMQHSLIRNVWLFECTNKDYNVHFNLVIAKR